MPAKKLLGILVLLSISIFMLVWIPNHIAFLSKQPPSSTLFPIMLMLQVVACGIGLITGPILFWARFRDEALSVHKPVGIIYLLACLVASLTALGLLAFTRLAWSNILGLILLNGIWLVTLLMTWRTMQAGDLAANRRWLLRSFSLTFSAVTLRLFLVVLFKETATSIPVIVLWLAWVPNLFLTELFICRELKAAEKAAA
ncbi:MAG: DUF2306 domain-containing protein [Bacteroidota bacterium]